MITYASFGRRLWATILDALVDLVVFGTIALFTGSAAAWGAFGFWYLLHHVGLVVEGGTIGHRLAGLRIVREDGERVDVVRAFVREISRLFLSLPPLAMGFLWMLDQPERRTWHDLLGGSVVVREVALDAAAAPAWGAAPPWRVEAAATRPEHRSGEPAV